jgi:hypothetical protein
MLFNEKDFLSLINNRSVKSQFLSVRFEYSITN